MKYRFCVVGCHLAERTKLGTNVIVNNVGAQQPKGGERTGPLGHQNTPHTEFFSNRGGVHRTSTAKWQKCEVKHVNPTLGRDHSNLVSHPHINNTSKTGCRLISIKPERYTDAVANRIECGVGVNLLGTA